MGRDSLEPTSARPTERKRAEKKNTHACMLCACRDTAACVPLNFSHLEPLGVGLAHGDDDVRGPPALLRDLPASLQHPSFPGEAKASPAELSLKQIKTTVSLSHSRPSLPLYPVGLSRGAACRSRLPDQTGCRSRLVKAPVGAGSRRAEGARRGCVPKVKRLGDACPVPEQRHAW